ncbi:hypothetical protein FNAPI_8517 [Fusarium napiforme]|uniref:Uncharacterized protein n=1 Tax=Fusarium napiforme TaxID=42672 RepID=A0A8H5J4K7_9HYPO|nr:hypothetical protein FNAPI_8517 [Fusarium napiforme]
MAESFSELVRRHCCWRDLDVVNADYHLTEHFMVPLTGFKELDTNLKQDYNKTLEIIDIMRHTQHHIINSVEKKVWTVMQSVNADVCWTALQIEELEEEPLVNEHPSYHGIKGDVTFM